LLFAVVSSKITHSSGFSKNLGFIFVLLLQQFLIIDLEFQKKGN